jgi:hypothetical protein
MTTITDKSFGTTVTAFYYLNSGSTNLDSFVNYLKETLKVEQLNLFSLLFEEDKHGTTLLNYLIGANEPSNLLVEILHKYKNEFKLITPNKWDFILTQNKNDCHKSLIDFYGQKYFDSIFNPNNPDLCSYSQDYFLKYYLSGQLNHLLIAENLKKLPEINQFQEYIFYMLIFLSADKEGVKKFILESANNEETKKSSNGFLFSKLLYKENTQVYNISGSSTTLIELKLNLPTEVELNLLIDNWGINKTSEVISDYLNLQKEYILQNKIPYTDIKFDKRKLDALMHSDIKIIDCGEILALALKNEPEILSYLLVTDVIKKEHLLCNIKNEKLVIRVNHHILQNTLNTNVEPRKKLKI